MKRYVQVGLGSRSELFYGSLVRDFKEFCRLVALCDLNQGRMNLANDRIKKLGGSAVPTYKAGDFERMVQEQKPDVVIVTAGPDVTHSDYIIRAMELGCEVITEKPMTTDETRCRKILDTARKTGKSVRVTFNYRYAPPRSQIKELIMSGAIGEVLSIDFAWMLDTVHGADYFRRWHRNRANSGSMLVHKSTHHFDLVNWWIEDLPEDVFCHASRKYYTPQRADELGLKNHGDRCLTCSEKSICKFALDLNSKEQLKALYLDNEHEDGYFRDRCVFSDQINIWDTMSVSVRYKRGAILNYMLHAYSPYEGYRVAFNGTKGRIEHHACERTYINGDGTIPGELQEKNVSITLIPEFSSPQALQPRTGAGGHGGGDPVMLNDLFHPNPPADPLKRAASQMDGAYSILVGVAAYKSIDHEKPVSISNLLT